jgi:hypothetical protein
MLDDGGGVGLIPSRPVIEEHLGRELRGTAYTSVSREFSEWRGHSLATP